MDTIFDARRPIAIIGGGEGFYTHPNPAYQKPAWIEQAQTPLLE